MSEVVDLLGALVAIDSVNPDLVPGGAGEGAIARFVAAWLERRGLAVTLEEAAPGRPNVIAVARGAGGGRSLMLNAHMDTVGVAGMELPFEARVEGNRLYGRGAVDMKGSLAAMMLAGVAAKERRLSGDVILTAVVDEEYGSIGTEAIVKKWRADAAIVTEPSGLDLCLAHKGFVWVDIETHGVAAHGSRPDLGIDAIAKMGHVLVGLEELDRALRAAPGHPLLGTGSLHASLIDGGQELSTYPDHCLVRLERRIVPGETRQTVEAEISALLERLTAADPTITATMTTGLLREPFEAAENEPIVHVLRRQATAALGHVPGEGIFDAWMDSALLAAAGIPTAIFGPYGEGLHSLVEWVDLESVDLCTRILLATATEFCS